MFMSIATSKMKILSLRALQRNIAHQNFNKREFNEGNCTEMRAALRGELQSMVKN